MQKVEINLYSFNELSKDARDFAIDKHRDFLLSIYDDSDFDESFNMNYSKYEKSLTEEYIIEEIEANEYLFFFNGELADIIHYCGKHPKTGLTELKQFGEIYTLNN